VAPQALAVALDGSQHGHGAFLPHFPRTGTFGWCRRGSASIPKSVLWFYSSASRHCQTPACSTAIRSRLRKAAERGDFRYPYGSPGHGTALVTCQAVQYACVARA
jgi:hypothetical protein